MFEPPAPPKVNQSNSLYRLCVRCICPLLSILVFCFAFQYTLFSGEGHALRSVILPLRIDTNSIFYSFHSQLWKPQNGTIDIRKYVSCLHSGSSSLYWLPFKMTSISPQIDPNTSTTTIQFRFHDGNEFDHPEYYRFSHWLSLKELVLPKNLINLIQ